MMRNAFLLTSAALFVMAQALAMQLAHAQSATPSSTYSYSLDAGNAFSGSGGVAGNSASGAMAVLNAAGSSIGTFHSDGMGQSMTSVTTGTVATSSTHASNQTATTTPNAEVFSTSQSFGQSQGFANTSSSGNAAISGYGANANASATPPFASFATFGAPAY